MLSYGKPTVPTIALVIWPIVSLIIFAKLPLKQAVVVSVLTGHLLLPERFEIDLRGLPAIEKASMILVGLILGLIVYRNKDQHNPAIPKNILENQYRLIGILMMGAIGLLIANTTLTVMTNREALVYGPVTLPGLPWRDVISMVTNVVVVAAPFIVARKLFSQPEDHRMLLQYLVVAALAYSALILIEIRLSPQLHRWVYGFHQHSFAQHIRGGVFRPKVFLDHGLTVGFFLFSACIAAGALFYSADQKTKTKRFIAFGFLVLVLIASRNLGATALILLIAPLLWMGRSLQIWSITIVTAIFLTYPAVRQAQILPLDQIHAFAEQVSPARAQSLKYRFDNEDILLEHALKKPISGWGGWNRARVFNQDGRDISTTDGLWIIQIGQQGWLGYIGFFSLLTFPLLVLFRVRKRKEIPIETIAIALIMMGNLIYLIPNATLTPIGWLFAGALAGFAQFDGKQLKSPTSEGRNPEALNARVQTYTRFPKAEQPSV